MLWTAALVVMIFGTFDAVREGHNSVALAWAIFLSVVAQASTTWMVVRRHHIEQEISVERVVEIVDALHSDKRDLSRVR